MQKDDIQNKIQALDQKIAKRQEKTTQIQLRDKQGAVNRDE